MQKRIMKENSYKQLYLKYGPGNGKTLPGFVAYKNDLDTVSGNGMMLLSK